MHKQETFESLMLSFSYRYDLRTVFDDFLTMALCVMCPNPQTGMSHDEDLYLQTIEKYKEDPLRYNFPKLFACLVAEMEERTTDSQGNDVLGDFYEQHLSRKGVSQYFTPWPVCLLMAQCLFTPDDQTIQKRPLRILDPCVGSGRLVLAGSRILGASHEYYGRDIDHTCVKMVAINLFLNGVFHGEVMWADALNPEDFRVSYKLSLLPLGVFRITEKEKSRLWYLHMSGFQQSGDFGKKKSGFGSENDVWEERNEDSEKGFSQLHLF